MTDTFGLNGISDGYVSGDKISDHGTIMQSTGLLDRNQVEIFEGDIIEIDRPHPSYKHTEKAEIKFGNHMTSGDYYASEAYGWYADVGGIEVYSMAQIHRPFEIIGNIHEHPELLEAK